MNPLVRFKVGDLVHFKNIIGDLIDNNIDFKVYSNFINMIVINPILKKENVVEELLSNYPLESIKKEYSYDHVSWVVS